MAGSGASQHNLRKAIGVLKDTTTVGFVKVNSDYKELDVAIVKATNHVEQLPKEKHIRTILESVSASRPRADVAYCINSLAKRLAKTHNWAVALKTLMVIHRALREVDASFRGELVKYSRSGHILNLSHFKDDSSPDAWDYSTWVRTYALYLEERLECLSMLNYDIETECSRNAELDTTELLQNLPALQQLLFRLLGCQPQGAAIYNTVIHRALSIIVGESIKIYIAINICILNLVDKFFDMQQRDAIRALEIYRRVGPQAKSLLKFYDFCRRSDFGRGQKFVKIEQPPASFVVAMEEYVKAPSPQLLGYKNVVEPNKRIVGPMPKLAFEHKKVDLHDKIQRQPTTAPIQLTHLVPNLLVAEYAQSLVPIPDPVNDLLHLDDFHDRATDLEERNSSIFAIVSDDNLMNNVNSSDRSGGSTEWELALMTASSSNTALVAPFNKLKLESLYADQISRTTNQNSSYPNPFESDQYTHDQFFASEGIDLAVNLQNQAKGLENNPFGPTGVSSFPTQDPYTGLM
ncbi:hypothetical protein KFK09_017448 [Dendrobium nobile]|uniref:ENTH domain-containing protein n=1 Tax=Dendrobium nobile TaxID=94219 RepID=A0A8T3B7E5_DENNO|nr:hypothetical protein KFK09_017448 [Dendrobium nobile]